MQPYNEPCEECGSTDQVLMISEDRKSVFCNNCNNYKDIYVSKELQQYWDNEVKNQNAQQILNDQKSNKPTVECPYCHSTNTKKISGLSKAGSVALFGVFAMGKVSKEWHCNNCNSDF